MRRVTIFDTKALAKLKADHNRLEHEVRDMRATLRRFVAGIGDADSGVYIAVTGAGGVPALAGATPGSATVTLKGIDNTGALISTSRTVTAYNLSATAVGANKFIQIKREWVTGKYVVDFEDCT